MCTLLIPQVAAQPRSGGSGTESDGGSSSSGRQFQEQQSRPVRDAHASIAAALPQQVREHLR